MQATQQCGVVAPALSQRIGPVVVTANLGSAKPAAAARRMRRQVLEQPWR